MFEECFSKEDLGKATYILGMKIYRDRSGHLIRLSQNTYLDKHFEGVQNGPVKEKVMACVIRCEIE